MLEFFLLGVGLAVALIVLSIGGAMLNEWLFPKPSNLPSVREHDTVRFTEYRTFDHAKETS